MHNVMTNKSRFWLRFAWVAALSFTGTLAALAYTTDEECDFATALAQKWGMADYATRVLDDLEHRSPSEKLAIAPARVAVLSSQRKFAEAEEIVIVEKKLSQYKISAAINLGLQPVPIDFAAFLAGDVALRKSGGADAETAHFLDEPDQLIGKLKTPFGFFEVSDSAAGGIPPQREDVFDAQTLRFQQDLAQFLRRRSDAGQMRHGG